MSRRWRILAVASAIAADERRAEPVALGVAVRVARERVLADGFDRLLDAILRLE